MEWNIESIIFYLLLLDATGAAFMAWSGRQHWWQSQLGPIARQFPLTRGWTTLYLCVVLLLGIIIYRLDGLVVFW